MTKYSVLFKAVVNVRMRAVEAATAREALRKSEELFDGWEFFPPAKMHESIVAQYAEYAEEIHEALVDEADDEEYANPTWYGREDHEWRQMQEHDKWVVMDTRRHNDFVSLWERIRVLEEELAALKGRPDDKT
jgi:hypothetical protein